MAVTKASALSNLSRSNDALRRVAAGLKKSGWTAEAAAVTELVSEIVGTLDYAGIATDETLEALQGDCNITRQQRFKSTIKE